MGSGYTPGGVLCDTGILAVALSQHHLPRPWILSKQAARVIDNKGRLVDGLGIVSLPDVEHRSELGHPLVVCALGREGELAKVSPQRVELAVEKAECCPIFDNLHGTLGHQHGQLAVVCPLAWMPSQLQSMP